MLRPADLAHPRTQSPRTPKAVFFGCTYRWAAIHDDITPIRASGLLAQPTHHCGPEIDLAWPSGQTSFRTSHRSTMAHPPDACFHQREIRPQQQTRFCGVPEPGNLRATIASADWTLSRA